MRTLLPFWTIEPQHVQLGLLAMIRLSAMLMVAPATSVPVVPVTVRVSLGFALLLLVWPALAPAAPAVAADILTLGGLAVSELGIGAALGFAARLVLAAASYASELAAMQMGFGLASVLDPAQGQQVTALTRLVDWAVLMLFLALDGHYLLIGAVVESFRLVPPGRLADLPGVSAVLLPLGGRLFAVGMALVAPVVGVLFLANLVLVMASRAVPALHLMTVGFPILIAVGLVMTMVNLDLLGGVVGSEIRRLDGVLVTVLRGLGHGR
jgi:flagellar biosynthetic protein FliR